MMGRQVPVRPDHRDEQAEDRERRLATLRARLQDTAQAIRTAEDWTRCLQTAAQLPGESWANILLITSRIPGATLVKGYEAWRSAGRQVRRDEKGIEIFSTPRRQKTDRDRDDNEQSPSWRDAQHVTYVWDLSQTSGQPLPVPTAIPPPAGEPPPGLWDCLCWVARRQGFAVERQLGCPADGTTLRTARRIRVLPDLAADQAVWALAHQLGHILLHDTGAVLPGNTTTGCQGIRRAEADAVAFIICARSGVRVEHAFSSPQTWAGTDPRAQPGAAILAAGERITTAAAKISCYLDPRLPGSITGQATPAQAVPAALTAPLSAADPPPEPDPSVEAVLLLDAEAFYIGQLANSWVPGYLRKRGITAAVAGKWRIGYAPRGWTALTTYLRGRGHPDDAIQAAGLARVSSRGTLIDHFRDRVMLPVHDEHGTLAGFIGRAHPGAGPNVPKYLNSPATSTYQKGDLLFGLSRGRRHLARGAVPVIVEGPFDAIAVSSADPGQYVGLAPCGTALTHRQAAALANLADLRQPGILVAFDDDAAGRKAAIRAHQILRGISERLQSLTLPGKDPAEILETEGPATLRTILRDRTQPLSTVIIDTHIDAWGRRLRDPEGPLLAMRSVAVVIADLLPPEAAQAIRQITGDKELIMLDEQMRPVTNPELPELARALPAETTYQIARTAERLGFTDYSDVLAEVANTVTRPATRPKAVRRNAAPRLADASFPHKPPVIQCRDEPQAGRFTRPGTRSKPTRTKYLPSS